MKRFKKAILITIVSLLIVALASIFIFNKVFGLYAGSDKIYGYDSNLAGADGQGHNIEYNLEDCYNNGKTVKLVQSYDSEYYGEQLNALNQPNIWCVQLGAELSYGEYSVSQKYTVQDPVLAYILANGPTEQQETYKDEWQYLLWYYLEDTADYGESSAIDGLTDKQRILKGIETEITELTESGKATVKGLYEDAKVYANNVSGNGISTSEITIEGDTATFTVTGDYDTLKVFLNGAETSYTIEGKKVSVDISGLSDSEITISVSATLNKYSAEYRILYGEKNLDAYKKTLQRLLVASGIKEEASSSSSFTPPTVELDTEVSLQKYITKVNGEALTEEQTNGLTERKNQMTEKADESLLDAIFGRTVKDNISGEPAEVNAVDPANKKYKRGTTDEDENAVKIELGDTVTYTIEVYNNSSITASEVVLKDNLPEGAELVEIKRDGAVVEWEEIAIGGDYQYKIVDLLGGQKTCFEVTLKFNEYSEETLVNTALISSTTPSNITDNYRIEDRDYVKMEGFKVSLEKFISKVNDEDLSSSGTNITEREGLAEHKYDDDPTTVDKTKEDNIVEVSKGDLVTYTIKVKNDGKSKVYISEVTDLFPSGVKYEATAYSDTMTQEQRKVIFNNISGTLVKANGTRQNFDKLSETLLEPEDSAYFTVEVEVIEDNLHRGVLVNTAKITKIKNIKEYEMEADKKDETPNDNEDSDYIQLNFDTPKPEKETTNFTVVKKWEPVSGVSHPTSVKVQLYRNNEKYEDSVTLSASNGWTYMWTGLDKKDVNGNEYVYSVIEDVPNGYTPEYKTDSSSKTTIINKITDTDEPKISKTVTKIWENDTASQRPPLIKVQLYKNGIEEDSVVELKASDGWKYTWESLDPGYNYSVKEVEVPNGYTVEYKNNGFTIINKKPEPEKTKYEVTKYWVDDDNATENRPATITLKLYRNSTDLIETVQLSGSGNTWYKKWTKLEKYDKDGNEYVYSVVEDKVPGYETEYYPSKDRMIISNKINKPDDEPEEVQLTVRKDWDDNNNQAKRRPDSIEVQLYQNGNVYGSPVTIKASEGWTHTWTELDTGYNYSVKENKIPSGYTVKYEIKSNEIIIKNTYKIDNPDDPYNPDNPENPDNYGIISGFVWNDIPLNKIQDNYNGIYDEGQEDKLSGIKVYLYREDVSSPICEKETNSDGSYSFSDSDIDPDVITKKNERYIKGPKDNNDNKWTGDYYSYHIVFEYDGIKYTTTKYNDIKSLNNIEKDSNVQEKLEDRTAFNDKFTTIKYDGAYDSSGNKTTSIEYETINEEGKIPQSKYVYNKETMRMTSSTDIIDIEEFSGYEEQLKYIGLGLRGRDVFDLEVISDVEEVEVIINQQQARYKNTNRVTLRKSDLNVNSIYEDMANIELESENIEKIDSKSKSDENYFHRYNQYIRNSDIDYLDNDLLYVTQKITIHNASRTTGIVNKIACYYEGKCMQIVKAFSDNGEEFNFTNSQDNKAVGSIDLVNGKESGKKLGSNDKLYVYVKYKITPSTFKQYLDDGYIDLYSVAEVQEYQTISNGANDEATRGLIDKDSRPGDAGKYQDWLFDTEKFTWFGNKCEDDTYGINFEVRLTDKNPRTITGTVFRDKTQELTSDRIKTGNAILDKGEYGVYGATVELFYRK